jgi:hypothetical protein
MPKEKSLANIESVFLKYRRKNFSSSEKNEVIKKNNKLITKKKISYSEESLRTAVEKVQSNILNDRCADYNQISKEFKIPASTIRSRVKNGKIVQGHYFTEKEEELLVNFIKQRQTGDPVNKPELIDLVNQYLQVINFYFISS